MDLEFHQLELRYSGLRVRQPGRDSRLLAALAEQGQQSPVVVVRGAEPRRYVLIDGYRRVWALQQLGHDTVWALDLPYTEVEALIWVQRQQQPRRRSALEQGWLVQELVQGHGLSQAELARRLGRSESWVSRRLGLVTMLPGEVQELVRTGEVCPQAAEKYLLPLSRDKAGDCIKLATGIAPGKLTERQVRLLYVAYRRGDEARRRKLLSDPLLALRALEGGRRSGPVVDRTDEEQLVCDLDALGGICRRAVKRLGKLQRRPEGVVLCGALLGSWQEASASYTRLRQAIKEVDDAGLRGTGGHPEAPAGGLSDSPDRPGAEGEPQDGAACAACGQQRGTQGTAR